MALFMTACHEDIDVFEPISLSSGDISRFFESVQAKPVTHSWDVSEEATIALPGKGQVLVPANAFAHLDGSPVYGVVQAEVLEVSDKGGLIRHNIGTAAGMQLLNLAGMVYLSVEQEGRPLQMVNGQSVRIQLATAVYDPQMRLFTATASDSDVLGWMEVPASENTILPAEVFDPSTNQWIEGIEIRPSSLGWTQCAFYLNNSPGGKVPACVKLPIGFSEKNTAVFLALQNVNAVLPFYEFGESLPEVCREGLPAGSKAEFIVIAEGEEGEYFFARQPIIITEGLTIGIVPEKVPLSEILFALENL